MLEAARDGMDQSVRPQDDLFGHVNGVWLQQTEIPDDRSVWGAFAVLDDNAEKHTRAIIEECAEDQWTAEEDRRKIGNLYRSFMDEERANALGLDPVRPVLAAIADLPDIASLAGFLGEFERIGAGGAFGSWVDTDDRDSDRYVVNLTQGGIGLPDESYYREEKFADIRKAYLAYLERMFTLAEYPDPAGSAQAVMTLETRLAEGHWDRVRTRDVLQTYNLFTFEGLEDLLPTFDFTAYIRNVGGSPETLAEVVVRQPSYLSHLDQVLKSSTIEEWRHFLAIRAIRGAAPYLSDEFVEANFDFYGRTLAGTVELRARWKRGVALVEGVLGEAVGREYVKQHFSPQAKERVNELVEYLLKAYADSISNLDWMTAETRERALEKLATFRPKVGYPDKWRDYSALQVSRDDLYGNVVAAAAYETDYQLAKIGAPVDRDEWFMYPQTVNAYYNPGTNEICFPAAILQPPFFSPDADPAENYGGIGAVIGHEIGHGFDDQGSQYDGHGNLHDWWTEADRKAFEEKSSAMIAQYNGFEPRTLPGERVNGALTVGENIGDLGGLTIALKAYRLYLADHPELGSPEDENADGLTGVQRLFLNWGHIWRKKVRPELELRYLTTDPHSPAEFRANIVRNLDEFHEAFNTGPQDELWLEPADRVRIW